MMAKVKVRIPAPLQKITQNKQEVSAQAANIRELILDLEKQFPGIKERLLDESGKIRRFINFYVNDEDIRFLKQDETLLSDGNEVSIIPAIAGGGLTRLRFSHFGRLYKPQVC
jgi:molybdopterin synthase sulfur carrier subunit